VHNAVQAAPAVTGVVTLAWESRGNEVEVRIEDNGPGIPPDALQAVFAPYATTKRRIGGTGLGLFIARKVIEEVHGGRIRLANRTEGGLSATIRIPVNGPGDERRNGAAGTAARTDAVGAGRPRES
jgi:signal transduction histidine kinase